MDRMSKMSTHKEQLLKKLASATTLEALQQGENLDGFIPIYYCRCIVGLGEQGKFYISMSSVTFVSSNILTLGLGKSKALRIPLESIHKVDVSPPNRISITHRGSSGEGRKEVTSWTPVMCSSRRLRDLIMAILDVDQKKTLKLTENGGLLYAMEAPIERESDDEFVVITSPSGGAGGKGNAI
jgi:hypothetical protein